MAKSLNLPLLAPGSVADVVRLGLHAVALSRYSGLWTGLQVIADIADGAAVVDLGSARDGIPAPDPGRPAHRPLMVGPGALQARRSFSASDPPRTRVRPHGGLNSVTVGPPGATVGVIAAGHTYAVVLRALEDMGIDADACGRMGLRLIRSASRGRSTLPRCAP